MLTERVGKGKKEYSDSKRDSNGRSATPTTVIPYSEGLAGDCGFAYPLLVYWNRSLSVFPFFPLFLSIRKSYVAFPIYSRRRRRRRSILPAPFILSRTPFVVLSSTRSFRPSESASLPSAASSPLVLFRLVLVSRSLSTYLYLSASLHCAIRCADPRPRTQSPPVPGFYYEIRDSPLPPPPSPGFVQVHPYLLTPRIRSPDATP